VVVEFSTMRFWNRFGPMSFLAHPVGELIMRNLAIVAGLSALAIGVAAPAVAQTQDEFGYRTPLPYDRGYDLDQPRTRAINEAERPQVEAANEEMLARAEEQTATGGVDYAQYDSDMNAYQSALADRDAAMAADQAAYAQQMQAYDQAMADWRMQVADCEDGVRAACDAPAPDPSYYYR
jgi:hypothetical protein